MQTKKIKCWGIFLRDSHPGTEKYELAGSLSGLVRNYAIFEDKITAERTLDFARRMNQGTDYIIVEMELTYKTNN